MNLFKFLLYYIEMIILKKQNFKLRERFITDKKSFLNRRSFILGMGGILASNILKD